MNDKLINITIKVKNMPDYDLRKYTVVRYVNGEFWYFATYDDYDWAVEVASEVNNSVVIGKGELVKEWAVKEGEEE